MRQVWRLAVVAMCLLVVGCSDDDEGSPATSSTSAVAVTAQPGPVAAGSYSLTGAVQAEGSFEVAYAPEEEQFATCETIADPDAESFIVPVPTVIGEQRLDWRAALREYTGPGTYDLPQLEGVTVGVRANPDAAPVEYLSVDGSTATLEVAAGNTGTFTFTGLRNSEGGELSGRLEWSCSIR